MRYAPGMIAGVRFALVASSGHVIRIRQLALLALLLSEIETGVESIGLSKGPIDPADIGRRCAPMAGRHDRGYLDCTGQAHRSSAVSEEGRFLDRLRLNAPGSGHDVSTRRYLLRGR